MPYHFDHIAKLLRNMDSSVPHTGDVRKINKAFLSPLHHMLDYITFKKTHKKVCWQSVNKREGQLSEEIKINAPQDEERRKLTLFYFLGSICYSECY